ncbi:MAG: tRNA (adenosine(37)-N6)-threonylcarbamoyltransferase complex ATPase subunit type 1 TsaE, partial [Woeseia sp.]
RLVYHVDLYRIGSADELEFLGWDELGDGLLLVEWPERVPELFTQADVCLQLAYDGDGRSITVESQSERAIAWQASLSLAPELARAVVP